MNCVIIEDQQPAQRILKKYIEDLGSLQLIGTFSNALDAMIFLKANPADVLFLDIHLPKLSGIDFLKSLKNPPQVILTTAFANYALESYELNVVDYLLKPFSFQRFVKAVSKIAIKETGNEKATKNDMVDNSIFIKSGHEHIKINTANILFIKSDADYTEVVTKEKMHLSSDALKLWIEKLDTKFCQVHKSYIVNTHHIIKVSGNQIYIEGSYKIPIGRAFKTIFFEKFIKE